jgi:hypothetical protein
MDNKLLRTTQSATLRYYDNISLNPAAAGVPGTHVFAANGTYDPNISGIGHQPRGFDELMELYDRIQCDEVTIEFAVHTTVGAGYRAAVALFGDTTTRTTGRDFMEARISNTALITNGKGPTILKMAVKPHEFLGLPKRGEHGLTGSKAANPAYQCFFHVAVWAINGTDDLAAAECDVKLVMKVHLTEPQEPASS